MACLRGLLTALPKDIANQRATTRAWGIAPSARMRVPSRQPSWQPASRMPQS